MLFQGGEECASPVRLTYFCRNRINVAYSAVFMLVGHGVALIVVYYYNLWQFPARVNARPIICTPINIFTPHNLPIVYPKILAVTRYEGLPGVRKNHRRKIKGNKSQG